MSEIGNLLRKDRKSKGWSAPQFWERLKEQKPSAMSDSVAGGVSYIYRIERGERKNLSMDESRWLTQVLFGKASGRYCKKDFGLTEKINQRVEESDRPCCLYATPADYGTERYDSPNIVACFYGVMQRQRGSVVFATGVHRYETVALLAALRIRLIGDKDSDEPKSMQELVETVEEILAAKDGTSRDPVDGGTLTEETLKWIDEKMRIYLLRENEVVFRRPMYRIARLHPASSFLLSRGEEKYGFYSYGRSGNGPLAEPDTTAIWKRFMLIKEDGDKFDSLSKTGERPFECDFRPLNLKGEDQIHFRKEVVSGNVLRIIQHVAKLKYKIEFEVDDGIPAVTSIVDPHWIDHDLGIDEY